MKKAYLTTLLALGAFSVVQAGEAYCPPPCKSPITYCDNSGYIFAYGGFAFVDEHTVSTDILGIRPTLTGEYDFGNNFILGAGVGLRSSFLGGTRFEVEGLWQNFDGPESTQLVIPGLATLNNVVDTDMSVKAVMVNFLKEFEVGSITAYAGAGIGMATVDYTLSANLLGIPLRVSDDDTVLAYQFILGAEYPVTECLSVFSQYKLLGVTEQEYGLLVLGVDGESFITHNLVFGARVSF